MRCFRYNKRSLCMKIFLSILELLKFKWTLQVLPTHIFFFFWKCKFQSSSLRFELSQMATSRYHHSKVRRSIKNIYKKSLFKKCSKLSAPRMLTLRLIVQLFRQGNPTADLERDRMHFLKESTCDLLF